MTSTEEIVDTYEEQKSEWIQQHGSDFLKETIEAGYFSNNQYAQERANVEYPGFELVCLDTFQGTFKETDSPPDFCFEACKRIGGAVCKHQGNSHKTYFAVIDDYLGRYQIAKKIEAPESTNDVRSSTIIDTDKDNWISQYGSELLKEMLKSGYKSNTQYAIERLAIDYPGFQIVEDRNIEQVDTPPSYCLEACRTVEGSYCGQYRYASSTYYLTIDKYLGSYQIAKEIVSPSREIKQKTEFEKLFEPSELLKPEESISEEKEDWIFLNGSDLLQKSTLAGYDVKDRYLKERLQSEYPGFKNVTELGFTKVDSPSKEQLKLCNQIEEAYCSYNYIGGTYNITIHDYLGKYTIAKKIGSTHQLIPSIIKASIISGVVTIGMLVLFNNIMGSNYPQPSIDPILVPVERLPVFPRSER
jgi:hypothetical protein